MVKSTEVSRSLFLPPTHTNQAITLLKKNMPMLLDLVKWFRINQRFKLCNFDLVNVDRSFIIRCVWQKIVSFWERKA